MDNQRTTMNYDQMSDEKLVILSRQDDSALSFLLEKYKNFVRSKTRPYFLIGADREDIIQEGMIGLYKAIRDYEHQKNVPFMTFADICITRQIITAVKAASRQKHIPLNTYVSLDRPMYDEETDRTLLDAMSSKKAKDPEQIYIRAENREIIANNVDKVLSKLELSVMKYYLKGMSYKEIAQLMDKDVKTVDNALQRVKKKLEKLVDSLLR